MLVTASLSPMYSKSLLNFQAQNDLGEKIYVYYSDEEKKAGVGIKPIRRSINKLL